MPEKSTQASAISRGWITDDPHQLGQVSVSVGKSRGAGALSRVRGSR
jgi:hypothetical protein